MGLEFYVDLQRQWHVGIISYQLCRGMLSPVPPTPIHRAHRNTLIYLPPFIISAIISAICYSTIPIIDSSMHCAVYITKSSPVFVYIILYCTQLRVAICVFVFIVIIMATTKRHHLKIAAQVPTVIEPKQHTNVGTTASEKKGSRNAIYSSIAKMVIIDTVWLVFTRMTCIIVYHLYLFDKLMSSDTLNAIYIYLYLSTSTYPTLYVLANKKFRKKLRATFLKMLRT